MKFSIVLAASAVSGSVVVPRADPSSSPAPNLPMSVFPKFEVISLDQAKQGLDRDIQKLPPKPVANLTYETDPGSAKPKFGVSMMVSPVNKAVTAASKACASAPSYRFEWRQYSDSRRVSLMSAMRCLINRKPSGRFSNAKNRWEDFVQLHQSVMPSVHNNAIFLLWHRYFLWTFEQVLRIECGFDRGFVWWDETKDAGHFAQSDMFTSSNYFGPLPGLNNGQPSCINSGAFAGMITHIGPGNSFTTHCISRGVTEQNTAQCNTNFVNYCLSRAAYADFETCLEYGPHGYGHNGIGGVMQDVWSSPSDPIFWMHHAFIDRVYYTWQLGNANRLSTIDSGVDANGKPLTLDTVLSMGGIAPDVKIRDVLNPLGGVNIGGVNFCYKYSY
ncbi:hypothetical protein BJ166DRAFT_372560 [Pestalotiopsis sp. NC0098]|nr:hypothetical protein BJ166DRAFT_372560 [Pestalotiopsis sp. NC0098]